MKFQHIDCFNINMRFWKFLGICIGPTPFRFYNFYSLFFMFVFVFTYNSLDTINLLFLPAELDIFVEELIFFFNEVCVISKVLTLFLTGDKIANIMDNLENPIFNVTTDEEEKILQRAQRFIKRFWRVVAIVSVISNITHVSSPFIAHLFLPVNLELPVCSYSFLSYNITQQFIYPLYFYQSIGMHFHMWYNVNIDTFFLGLMVLIIGQLEILDLKLRTVTEVGRTEEGVGRNSSEDEVNFVKELNKCIIHFDEIGKLCKSVEDAFSATFFMQFNMASCIICVILFRFTLPAPIEYFIFLVTYMMVMILQIFLPCWFGTRIMDKSVHLRLALYDCDWTSRSRQFKSNMRLFVERVKRPLSITGGKMFLLSLATFTSIMNSAYSFFTLLRHMQSRE